MCTHLSPNWYDVIMWVSDYSYPMIPVIGHLRDWRVNHMHLDGVFLAVFVLFAKQIKYNLNFFRQRGIQRLFVLTFCSDFLAFCYNYD